MENWCHKVFKWQVIEDDCCCDETGRFGAGSLYLLTLCLCLSHRPGERERRFSTKQVVVVVWPNDSGGVGGGTTTRKLPRDRGVGSGPHMSKVHCPGILLSPKILPMSFLKTLSCFKICCVCVFHVSEKRRWWWLQHCLWCMCVCVCVWLGGVFIH